jgi:hypothetical protein
MSDGELAVQGLEGGPPEGGRSHPRHQFEDRTRRAGRATAPQAGSIDGPSKSPSISPRSSRAPEPGEPAIPPVGLREDSCHGTREGAEEVPRQVAVEGRLH